MRRLAYLLLALCSALLTGAGTRPHYGGALRVQLIAMFPSPDAVPLVAETLLRFDEHGDLVPLLARGWQSDAEKKRWRFIIRSKVVTPAAIAATLGPVLKKAFGNVAVTSTAQTVVIQSQRPMPDLLERLSRPETGIPGTGPFRLSKWEAGHRATLEANEDYPGGRPFVDMVDFIAGPARPAAYPLNAADIWELPVGISRRAIPDGMRVWTSAPLDLIALNLINPEAGLRDALSMSIDRAAIVNVLTQRRGEIAQGLLPQWLTGYEFLFAAPFDAVQAREAAGALKNRALVLRVPPSDPLARSVADRVMVNARDAGLALQSGANANVEMLHIRLDCAGAARALREIAGNGTAGDLTSSEGQYRAERGVLDQGRLIPLLHVPDVFGIGPRVRSSTGLPTCDLLSSIPNLWLTP